MKWLACLTLTFLTACATAPANDAGICSATAKARTELAGALVRDGGPESRRAGLAIIEGIDGGCGDV